MAARVRRAPRRPMVRLLPWTQPARRAVMKASVPPRDHHRVGGVPRRRGGRTRRPPAERRWDAPRRPGSWSVRDGTVTVASVPTTLPRADLRPCGLSCLSPETPAGDQPGKGTKGYSPSAPTTRLPGASTSPLSFRKERGGSDSWTSRCTSARPMSRTCAQLRRIDVRESDLRAHHEVRPGIGRRDDRVAVDHRLDVGDDRGGRGGIK
jgi:hypothetical protein